METKEQQQQSETKEMTDSTENEGKREEDAALDAGQEEAQETESQEPSFQELYEESEVTANSPQRASRPHCWR